MALARVTASPPSCESGPTPTLTRRLISCPDILLGGDASHSQDLYLPVPTSPEHDLRLPLPVIDGQPQLAVDPALATYTIGQLTRMSAEENVMVLLAHEGEAEGVVDVYPGDLGEWKAKGWKEAKERGLKDRAEARRRGRT
jgi:hypothetical protein